MGSRWELRHLAGSAGGGGGVSRLCHTLIRVNTVCIKQNKQTNHVTKYPSDSGDLSAALVSICKAAQ